MKVRVLKIRSVGPTVPRTRQPKAWTKGSSWGPVRVLESGFSSSTLGFLPNEPKPKEDNAEDGTRAIPLLCRERKRPKPRRIGPFVFNAQRSQFQRERFRSRP